MDYREIDAFFPFYREEDYTHTCVLFRDNTKQYIRHNIRHYIDDLFYEACLNSKAVCDWSRLVLGLQNNLPLLLSEQQIFIPIKFRKQLYIPGHAFTFGYVNAAAIAHFSDTEVILTNETILETLSPTKFIEKKLIEATLLKYAYRANNGHLTDPSH